MEHSDINSESEKLTLNLRQPVKPGRAGLFISIGEGTHIHRMIDNYELIFVQRGHLHIFEEQRLFDVQAGQCLLLWPQRHHGGTAPYEKDLSFFWMHFTLDDNSQTNADENEEQSFSVSQISTPIRPNYLGELYRRLLDDQEREAMPPVRKSLQIMQILCEASYCNPQLTPNEAAASLAGRIQTFIDEHNTQLISTSDIAREMGYNEDYIGRVFRQARQMTITEAIHRSQIRLAKMLLQSNSMNVNQVAQHCGHNDTRYFIRLFKRYEGLTPTAFRKLYSRVFINRY